MNIIRYPKSLVWLLFVGFLAACNTIGNKTSNEVVVNNSLTEEEKQAGWKLLIDGETFDGWRGLGCEAVPAAYWKIDDGTIR